MVEWQRTPGCLQKKLSPNSMRGELAEHVKSLTNLRKNVIAEGIIGDEKRTEYAKRVVAASKYCDCVLDPAIEKPFLAKILALSADPAVYSFDSLQNAWWIKTPEGKELVSNLRMLSIHYFHSAASGDDTTHHCFQIVKHLYEADREERAKIGFIMPANGGIGIPAEFLNALLAHHGGSNFIMSSNAANPLRLSLDWSPPDSSDGVTQADNVRKLAKDLGYVLVDFRMPKEQGYDALQSFFGERLKVVPISSNGAANWLGVLKTESIMPRNESDGIMESLEFGEKSLYQVDAQEFGAAINRKIISNSNETLAISVDSIQFSQRVLFTYEFGENKKISVGLFFPEEPPPLPAFLASIEREVVGVAQNSGLDQSGWDRFLKGMVDQLKASFGYAILTKKNTDFEITLEVCENTPKWMDFGA